MTRVALVTGSTRGIGLAIAESLLQEGWRVVINSARSVEVGAEIARSWGDFADYVAGDIGDPMAVEAIADHVAGSYGRIDAVVNNAAITETIPHDDIVGVSTETFEKIIVTNVVGTWNVIRAFVDLLSEGGSSSITNVASLAGMRPIGSSVPYAVSKAGIVHLTRLLAKALGPNIRVNAVAPGFIDTGWSRDWIDARRSVEHKAPLKRVGTVEDVASVVLALIRAEYVTGEVVRVDGGLGLKL